MSPVTSCGRVSLPGWCLFTRVASEHMLFLESAPLLCHLPCPGLSVIKEERSFLFWLSFVITTRDAENQGCFLSNHLLQQTSAGLNQKGPASCLWFLRDSPEVHLEPHSLAACSSTPGLLPKKGLGNGNSFLKNA